MFLTRVAALRPRVSTWILNLSSNSCLATSRYQTGSGVSNTNIPMEVSVAMTSGTIIWRSSIPVSFYLSFYKVISKEHAVTRYAEVWSRYLVKQLDHNISLNLHRYVWYEMGLFALSTASGRTKILCFDTPERFRRRLFDALSSDPQSLDELDIYQLHVYLVEQILHLYDKSVWAICDVVRDVEKVGGMGPGNSATATEDNPSADLKLFEQKQTSLCFTRSQDTQFT